MNILWSFVYIALILVINTSTGATDEEPIPTITVSELTFGVESPETNPYCKKVLISMLNDFMALLYSIETPYTTGKRILPTDITIEDVNRAIEEPSTLEIYRKVFKKIADTEKKGDFTPQSAQLNDHLWDPKFAPVLELVVPNYKTNKKE